MPKHKLADEHLAGWTMKIGEVAIAEFTHHGIDYPCNIFKVKNLMESDISFFLTSAHRPPDDRIGFANRRFDVVAADDEFNLGPFAYDENGEITFIALRDYRVERQESLWSHLRDICQRIWEK